MKRYISLVMAVVVLVMSLAIPSYADEVTMFQVLDYSLPNGGNSRSVNGYDGINIYFDLPVFASYYYVDMLIRTDFYPFKVDFRGLDLNVELINDDSALLYRVYGDINGWNLDRIDFNFHCDSGQILIFESFRISTLHYVAEQIPYNLEGHVPTFDGSLTFDISYPGSSSVYMRDYTDQYFDDDTWWCILSPATWDWKKYDYVDIMLHLDVGEINSISATCGGGSIPYEVSYIEDPDPYLNQFIVTIRLDLTTINRNDNELPTVWLTGIVANGICSWSILDVSAYYSPAEPSPFMYWFSKVGTWFSSLHSDIGSWFQLQIDAIGLWGRAIVQAINPDAGAADELIDEGSQKADQVDGLTDQMNSVVKPDLSGGGDISSIISPGDMSSYTVFLSTVVNAPYIGQVVMLSLILSLAGYVLFGKR